MHQSLKFFVHLAVTFSVCLRVGHGQKGQSDETHPCYRICEEDKPMVCGYNFTVEHFWSMSKACFNCPNVTNDCDRLDCIPLDGNSRAIAVVNRKLPGPAIRVCKGDRIIVDVENRLFGEGTAIHWHGMHQKETPWMDGVPGLTQCLIPTLTKFRYEFEAPRAGTFFWHSHAGFQRGDGVFGSLVVREQMPENYALYEYDLPEHEILLLDWLDDLSAAVFLNHHHSSGDNKPEGILVNGKGFPPGFFDGFSDNETLRESEKAFVPVHELRIKQGYSYRFRIISNGFLNCPLQMSIEDHKMQVISSDGFDIKPMAVDSIVIYAGERWDVVVRGSNPVGSYWIKFQGLMDCDNRFTSAFQTAVLNYEGVPPGTLPNTVIKSWEEAGPPIDSTVLNPLNIAPGEATDVTVAEISASEDDDPEIIEKDKADHQFYISYDFNPIDNIWFHGPHIPLLSVKKEHKLYTPQLNYISNVMPETPFLTQPEGLDTANICNEQTINKNCSQEYCECTHVLKVNLNSIVELVLVDRGYTFDANHPFHLHGHGFRIVAMERINGTTEPYIIKQMDTSGEIHRIRKLAPIKDTVTVPDGGYTIVRFRANNPGFWLFHCHIGFHAEIGMGLAFQVGDLTDMKKAPAGFPKCGSFLPPINKGPVQYDRSHRNVEILLKNTSNPYHPSYDTLETYKNLTTTARSVPKPINQSNSGACKISSQVNYLAILFTTAVLNYVSICFQ